MKTGLYKKKALRFDNHPNMNPPVTSSGEVLCSAASHFTWWRFQMWFWLWEEFLRCLFFWFFVDVCLYASLHCFSIYTFELPNSVLGSGLNLIMWSLALLIPWKENIWFLPQKDLVRFCTETHTSFVHRTAHSYLLSPRPQYNSSQNQKALLIYRFLWVL